MQSIDASEVLRQWRTGVRALHIAHSRAAASYGRRGRLLGTPAAALSAIVATSIFASLQSSEQTIVLLVAGVLSLAATVLSALQSYLNYGDLAARHTRTATSFGQLRRDIDMILATTTDAAELASSMAAVRDKWAEIEEAAPVLVQQFHDQATRLIRGESPVEAD